MMIVMIAGFASCGNSNSSNTEQVNSVMVVDEVVRGEAEGFGRCLVSGCYCKEFEGRGQTCRNCGHAYKKHY